MESQPRNSGLRNNLKKTFTHVDKESEHVG